MENQQAVIQALLQRLRASYGSRFSVLEESPDRFSVRLGTAEEAVVGVFVSDPERPSFRVSYAELRIRRNGRRQIVDVTRDNVLEQGVAWIVKKVAKHGYVPPG